MSRSTTRAAGWARAEVAILAAGYTIAGIQKAGRRRFLAVTAASGEHELLAIKTTAHQSGHLFGSARTDDQLVLALTTAARAAGAAAYVVGVHLGGGGGGIARFADATTYRTMRQTAERGWRDEDHRHGPGVLGIAVGAFPYAL